MYKITWERLRYDLRIPQLRTLASLLGVDISDIPVDTSGYVGEHCKEKGRIAERIWRSIKNS
jgi:hypothetical protein